MKKVYIRFEYLTNGTVSRIGRREGKRGVLSSSRRVMVSADNRTVIWDINKQLIIIYFLGGRSTCHGSHKQSSG